MTNNHHPFHDTHVQDPMFPSPHWTVDITVTFDGLRSTVAFDATVAQWFTEKCIDSWTSTTYHADQLLSELLPALAEVLAATAARVSPF